MINIVYGLKGSGKTKRIIDKANARAASSNGCVVYITDQPSHSLDIDKSIRFIDIGKYGISTKENLLSFIKGLLAGNYDITDIFADGPAKFIKEDVSLMENFYRQIEILSDNHSVSFIFTVSAEEPPEFMRKYM